MGLTWALEILLVDLLLGIIIGHIATRTWHKRSRRNNEDHTATVEVDQASQCEELLVAIEECLIRHDGDLEAFVAAVDHSADGEMAVNTPEQFASLQASNKLLGETLDDALARLLQFASRFRSVAGKEMQKLTDYRLRTVELSRTTEVVDGPASASDVVHRLLAAIRALRHENKRLREQLIRCQQSLHDETTRREAAEKDARIDSLTGLPNRRAFEERIAQLQASHERHQCQYAVVLIDLDRFKLLNDRRGHAAGDAVLAMVAQVLRDCCRTPDHVSRYGGEEFAVVVPNSTGGRAAWLAERCRLRIEMARLRLANCDLQVTASVGVAQVRNSETTAQLLVRADAALYAAKQAGRNAVRVDGQTGRRVEQLVELQQQGLDHLSCAGDTVL